MEDQAMQSAAKCEQCGREVPLVPGEDVCHTCHRLRARQFGGGALVTVLALSLVPVVCGLFLMTLSAPASKAMTLLYKGGGLTLLVGGPFTSLYVGVARGGLRGVLTALAIAVLAPLIAWALMMIDFFGIIGRGWGT